MKKKIRIHGHPTEEAAAGICASHCIIDLKLFNAIREKYGEFFDPAPLPTITYTGVAECNCELKAKIRLNQAQVEFKNVEPWWICPQHGYKRL